MKNEKERQIVHDWTSGSLQIYEIETDGTVTESASSGDEYLGHSLEDSLEP